MNLSIWEYNALIVFLTGVQTIALGYALVSVKDPQLNLQGIFAIGFNPWFIVSLVMGIFLSVFSFYVKHVMGLSAGQLFLTLPTIAVLIVGYTIFGNRLSLEQIIGMVLILGGIVLVGQGA
jgi:drug/metabolite transporter (DMT)-like permease